MPPKIDRHVREWKYNDENHKHYWPSKVQAQNGVTIWTLPYKSVSFSAQDVIYNIRNQRLIPGGHKRDGKRFWNDEQYLPDDGEYYEFSAADKREWDPGACVIIWDSKNERYYYTATHYRSFATSTNDHRNPFYRIKDIPWEKDGSAKV